MQVPQGDLPEQRIAVGEGPPRGHVGVHEGVEQDVREGADVGTRERCGPGERVVRDGEPSQHGGADRFAEDAREGADDERTEQGVGHAVQDGPVRQDADKGLDVHEHLRAAEDHEAEMAAAQCLEDGAGAEMEGREWHALREKPDPQGGLNNS